MDWDEHFKAWRAVVGNPGPEAHLRMQASRKRVQENSPGDWAWLTEGLADPDRKSFVARVFERQPVPKRLLYPFLAAAVLEKDPSLNRIFIEPCVRSWGADVVRNHLLRYFESGNNEEKAGAASALYWVRGDISEEMRLRIREALLRQFVENQDLDVRCRTLPLLRFEPELYGQETQPLIPIAIDIARNHSNEYIRHRIEVQLGAGGPFKAIPT